MLEFGYHIAQFLCVVRPLVFRYAQPIHGSGCNGGVRISVQNLLVDFFCVSPPFAHQRNARQSHQELGGEVLPGQVSFDAETFFPVLIKNDRRGGPDGLKAGKPGRVFLDMDPDRNKVLLDKR